MARPLFEQRLMLVGPLVALILPASGIPTTARGIAMNGASTAVHASALDLAR